MRKLLVLIVITIALLGCKKKAAMSPSAISFANTWSEKTASVRNNLENQNSIRTDLKVFNELKSWSDRKTKELTGTQRALFDALSQYYNKGRVELGKSVDAFQRLEDAGGADFQALLVNPDKAKIDRHAELVAELATALQAMAEYEKNAAMEFRDEISKTITDTQTVSECVGVFISMTTNTQRDKNREADAEFCSAFEEAIQLVLEDWPEFEKLTAENGNGPFSFSAPVYGVKWDVLMERMMDAKKASQQD